MSEKNEGSAGPALAAHSKDASVKGATPASSQTDNSASAGKGPQLVREAAGQIGDAAGRAASSVSDTAQAAAQTVSRQAASAAEDALQFVRDQPLAAVMATGAVCFMLGTLITRR